MNPVDAYVTNIIETPYFKYKKWWVKVEYECYGIYKTELMFTTKEEAEKVYVGYEFLT